MKVREVSNRYWSPRLENHYQPFPARIIRKKRVTDRDSFFQLRLEDRERADAFAFNPGQFMQLSIPGVGEFPVTICSSPAQAGVIDLVIRRVGRATETLHGMEENDLVGLRGPYGNGFPMEFLEGRDLLMIGGGLGIGPIRSVLWYAVHHRGLYGNLCLIFGAKRASDVLFREELDELAHRRDVQTLYCLEEDDPNWPYEKGRVTDFIELAAMDLEKVGVVVCGPPVMYRFVFDRLIELGFPKDAIFMTLERRMKCGIGKCGHCICGTKYVCLDGPVFTYWDIVSTKGLI